MTAARVHEDGVEAVRDRCRALFAETRARTEKLAARLSAEDQQLQSMSDASPTKWHRAHTTWFFETFLLAPRGVAVFDPTYGYLFNSYYDAVGPRHARPKRGLLSRPGAAEVGDYRRAVDASLQELIARSDARTIAEILPIVELGVAHEEQHQELILTDILHAFSENPLHPAFRGPELEPAPSTSPRPMRFVPFGGGAFVIGASEPEPFSFSFDNERPRHKVWVEPFELGDRLVTVAELKAFIDARGYQTPSLWLAEGFDFVRANAIQAPLYATYDSGEFSVFSLSGIRSAADDEPACHLSYYEADAVARFLGARLPTETEWEVAASQSPMHGRFLDDDHLRALPAPAGAHGSSGVAQLYGDAWEWTRSSYEAYPGHEAPAGALGEYNGKFMVNQRVLRGGSCLTPRRHIRASYRNFWHAPTRFQMTGLRLARGVGG